MAALMIAGAKIGDIIGRKKALLIQKENYLDWYQKLEKKVQHLNSFISEEQKNTICDLVNSGSSVKNISKN
jgi:hypothetical protein